MHRSSHNYSVADFLELRAADRLFINKKFQRNEVWKTPAKIYLIDSLLRDMPIPKMYFRTLVDPETQSSVREVVDGQQRLQAIFQFADDQLKLDRQAREFAGKRYSDLDADEKEQFLSYTFTAEQLIGATDDDVLEVFARINTYTVSLNPAELRHARWQGQFKWAAHDFAREWVVLWERFKIVPVQQRTRMADDELMAQLLVMVSQGLVGGEKAVLDKAYKNFDSEFPEGETAQLALSEALQTVTGPLSGALVGPLAAPAHFAILVAAVAYCQGGLGVSPEVSWLKRAENLPAPSTLPSDQDGWDQVRDALVDLAGIIEQREQPDDPAMRDFWDASRSRTINLASRERRFPFYLDALASHD